MTEQAPTPSSADDEALSSAPTATDEIVESAPAARRRRSHSRIAALSIAAAVLLTAGAGAGAWGATALSNAGAATTSIGGTQSGTGSSGGSTTQTGPGFGPGSGFGSNSGSGSASGTGVNSTTASATQIQGVVTITSQLGYANGESAGTGIVLTSAGRILTNNHVIDGATSISVTDKTTGRSYTATVVGTSATADIAVLQLSGASGLQTASIASGSVTQGAAVTAVGNAEGTGTLTAAPGTVSAVDQQITTQAEGTSPGETLNGLIETTADVVSGDSGGPLKNASGQVVGITTAATSGSTNITGYAIPIGTALSVARQIVAGQASSTITIGYPAFIGVSLDADRSSTPGAVIAGVLSGTPAAGSGLVAGDVITAVDGTTVGSASALSKAIGAHKPGDHVTITYTDAQGASQTASVTLIQGPAN